MVRTVKVVDAVEHVGARVRMHQVNNDLHAHGVRLVDKILEVVGRARPGRDGEEARHVIAEAAIVSVLLDGHKLDHVVARLLDFRQDLVRIEAVGGNTTSFVRHANMRLIDAH